jgi:hypothetical protein
MDEDARFTAPGGVTYAQSGSGAWFGFGLLLLGAVLGYKFARMLVWPADHVIIALQVIGADLGMRHNGHGGGVGDRRVAPPDHRFQTANG